MAYSVRFSDAVPLGKARAVTRRASPVALRAKELLNLPATPTESDPEIRQFVIGQVYGESTAAKQPRAWVIRTFHLMQPDDLGVRYARRRLHGHQDDYSRTLAGRSLARTINAALALEKIQERRQ